MYVYMYIYVYIYITKADQEQILEELLRKFLSID